MTNNKKINNYSLILLILFISMISLFYISNTDMITIYAKTEQNSSNSQENALVESSEEYIDVEDKYSDEILYASIISTIW
jgi:uncharacterized membrane protein